MRKGVNEVTAQSATHMGRQRERGSVREAEGEKEAERKAEGERKRDREKKGRQAGSQDLGHSMRQPGQLQIQL